MTRDEAKSRLLEATANECTVRWMEDFIDSAAALGILKLDEIKSPEARFLEALAPHGIHFGTNAIFTILDVAGLKVVEK